MRLKFAMFASVVALILMITFAEYIMITPPLVVCLIFLGICLFFVICYIYSKRERHSIEGEVEGVQVGQLTTIHFKDGRKKSFNGIPKRPILAGRYYFIVYDGLGNILSAEEWTPDSTF